MRDPKNILITGASSGIGAALALCYAAPDVTLYLSGRNEERLADTVRQCAGKGARVEGRVVHVTDRADMTDWIAAADGQTPLDLIIANAGISGGTAGRMTGEPIEQARFIFDVNVTGVLNTIEPSLPLMVARKRGQVAIISSLSAFRGWPGAPAYSASKGAVRFYGEALRGSLKRTGVQVNVICPGFIKSRMTAANDFPMPFLMEADCAAQIIRRNLARDKGRIAFPFAAHFAAWAVSVLPDRMAQAILTRLPDKS